LSGVANVTFLAEAFIHGPPLPVQADGAGTDLGLAVVDSLNGVHARQATKYDASTDVRASPARSAHSRACHVDCAWSEVAEPARPPSGFPDMMVTVGGRACVVVDNSKGAEPTFVLGLQAALSAAGFKVELHQRSPRTIYDTAVHFVVEGVSVRVPEALAVREFGLVTNAVRDAAVHRGGDRQRSRAVPIYRGETNHVLAWVDALAQDAL